MRYEFMRTVPAEELRVGHFIEYRGAVGQICHMDGQIMAGFPHIQANIDHPDLGRIACDIRVGDRVHVLTPTDRPIEVLQETSWVPPSLRGTSESLTLEERWLMQGGNVDGQQITLEGFGAMAGKGVDATLLEKGDGVAKLEIKVGDKSSTLDFSLSTGKPLKDAGDSGFQIPKTTLRTITGAVNKKSGGGGGGKLEVAHGPVTQLAPTGKCLCGCGAETKSRFRPGHDAKFHSMVKKALRGQLGEKEVPDTVVEEVNHQGGFGSQKPEPAAASA